MPSIATTSYTVMMNDNANTLADKLNAEEAHDAQHNGVDAWTFAAIPADHAKNGGARPSTCQPGVKHAIANGETVYTVAVHDEDGEFIGYL